MAAPSVPGQSERQNPVHVPQQQKLWQHRALCSSWICRGSAGHGLRLGIPKDMGGTSLCYSRAAQALKHNLGPSFHRPATLGPSFHHPAICPAASQATPLELLKAELRSNLVPSHRCSTLLCSSQSLSKPQRIHSARQMGKETKHWDRARLEPDIHHRVSQTSTKLFSCCCSRGHPRL